MQEVEFIKTLQKAGYSYEEFGRLVKLVKKHLYQEFFVNYNGEYWPEDPEAFLEDAFETAEPDDPPKLRLSREGVEMGSRYDFMDMEGFEYTWFEEADRLYCLVLDILRVDYTE